MSKGSKAAPTAVTSQRFYDAYSHGYVTYLEQHSGYFQAVERVIFAAAADRRGIAVLDVGTGTGERLQRVVSVIRPDRVVAIDESPEMAALAQRNCPTAEVHAVALGSPDLPAAIPGTFDLVICLSNVLGHVPRTQLVPGLNQIRNMLKPGGAFVFDVNNRYNAVRYGVFQTMRNMVRDGLLPGGGDFVAAYRDGDTLLQTPVHLFSRAEVVRLVRSSGFEIVDLEFRDYATGRERNRFGGSIVVEADVP
ncbi:class I SAM-dependent methyltransferase [Nocardia sp. CNY236]|uniref:class I SAM-dependent DNA methyltransferase n=1 Tax=Nocardia sp. CNY236 TaxID=1169152 RepID=UPI00040C9B6B|nr:class I SAM-dependent methyltransferase [Nocardia sp. CNY236]